MPGPYWTFEKDLLLYRATKYGRNSTHIVGLESDPEIYSESLVHAPGGKWTNINENEMSNGKDTSYIFGNIESYVNFDTDFDGAWLDFSGAITIDRLDAVYALWKDIRHSLVVTFMGHRHKAPVSRQLQRCGGSWEKLFGELLSIPPRMVEKTWYSYHHVGTGTTFIQLTIRK